MAVHKVKCKINSCRVSSHCFACLPISFNPFCLLPRFFHMPILFFRRLIRRELPSSSLRPAPHFMPLIFSFPSLVPMPVVQQSALFFYMTNSPPIELFVCPTRRCLTFPTASLRPPPFATLQQNIAPHTTSAHSQSPRRRTTNTTNGKFTVQTM